MSSSRTPGSPSPKGRAKDEQTPRDRILELGTVEEAKPPATPKPALIFKPVKPSARRTPGAGRLKPKSPHVARAVRALTPGRERRRSGLLQRETPRDALRLLSRHLAHSSQVPQATPGPTPRNDPKPHHSSDAVFLKEGFDAVYDDDDDDGEVIQRPRESINLNVDRDDSDEWIRPPRLSAPPEDMEASRVSLPSPGVARRARSEQPSHRDSLFGPRTSDFFSGLHLLAEVESPEAMMVMGDEPSLNLGEGHGSFHIGMDDDDDGQMGAIPAYEESYEETPRGPFLQSGDNDDFNYPLPVPQNPEESGPDDDVERSDPISAVKTKGPKTAKRKKEMKCTRDGLEFPPFPKKVIKKLATTVSDHKITNETLNVLARATDAFFEQAAEDLSAYAQHAKRRTIDDSDVIQLMRRQRHINAQTTVLALAQKHLPRELSHVVREPHKGRAVRRQTG